MSEQGLPHFDGPIMMDSREQHLSPRRTKTRGAGWHVTVLKAFAVAILLGGIFIAVGAGVIIKKQQIQSLHSEFFRERKILVNSVKSRIECSLKNARTLAAALTLRGWAQEGNISRMEFSRLVDFGDALVDGIYGISWIPCVSVVDLPAFEAYGRQQYANSNVRNFHVKPPPDGTDPQIMPVFLIQPEDVNLGAIGFNLFSNPARKKALDKARDAGMSTTTARIILAQEKEEGGGNFGVLYITPVYAVLDSPETLSIADRRRYHKGFVNGVIRIEDFIRNAEDSEAAEQHLEWFLYDNTALQEGSEDVLLYADKRASLDIGDGDGAHRRGAGNGGDGGDGDAGGDGGDGDAGGDGGDGGNGGGAFLRPTDVGPHCDIVTWERLQVADREWLLVTRPTTDFVAQYVTPEHVVWASLIIVVTLLLFLAVLLMAQKGQLDRTLQAQKDMLYDTLERAKVICEAIVLFDLDAIESDPHADGILGLLYGVARNLELYRPHLPHHFFALEDASDHMTAQAPPPQKGHPFGNSIRTSSDTRPPSKPPSPNAANAGMPNGRLTLKRKSLVLEDHVESTDEDTQDRSLVNTPSTTRTTKVVGKALASQFAGVKHAMPRSPKSRRSSAAYEPERLNPLECAPQPSSPSPRFEQHRLSPTSPLHPRNAGNRKGLHLSMHRKVTLVYVKLHQMEQVADHVAGSQVGDLVHVMNVLVEVMLPIVRDTCGVVQMMEHASVLISWNFTSTCSQHSENGCAAAVRIRDAFAEAASTRQLLHSDLSIGIWTGSVLCGSFGSHNLRATGLTGRGMRRVVELQQYCSAMGIGIVANQTAFAKIQPTMSCRLLAVDVLSAVPCNNDREASDQQSQEELEPEIVYEVINHISTKDTEADEWMYELMEREKKHPWDREVLQLFEMLKAGVANATVWDDKLRSLERCDDPSVKKICSRLRAIEMSHDLCKPYAVPMYKTWCL